MSIQHLHYCVKEIITAKEFLEYPNCDFYKRAVTRLIAIRNDDFTKIGFKVNKDNGNSRVIRNDLNALEQLYKSYFKLQRDKYGAHFQDLALQDRIEAWANIELTRANFFSTIPLDIYSMLAAVPGYVPIQSYSILNIADINLVNEKYDIEKYPNFSGDILSLTRHNSGGIIHFSGLQTKAGVVKSIELLIDYELAILKVMPHKFGEIFKKLFITDLISYADNFITRIDITPSEVQFEYGLDYYLSAADFPEHEKIMSDFKANYKFETLRSELRLIRNKVSGHIDTSLTVSQIQHSIIDFELEKFEAFYHQIKNCFKKLCFTEMVLRTFALNPFDRLHGVIELTSLPIKTFDGGPEPEPISFEPKDINDEQEYEKQLRLWIDSQNEETRQYFWKCISSSEILSHQNEPILWVDGTEHWINNTIRKIHGFFKLKLIDNNISVDEKTKIVDLFISLAGGYPDSLAHILIETYPSDLMLQRSYIKGLGMLLSNPVAVVAKKMSALLQVNDFGILHEVLLAMFRIDLRNRFNNQGDHLTDETIFSLELKKQFTIKGRPIWANFTLALSLSGEYIFGRHHTGKSQQQLYFSFLEKQALDFLNKIVKPLIKKEKDRRDLRSMQHAFDSNRYATLIAILGEFLNKRKYKVLANKLFVVIRNGFIEFSKTDVQELHNYAFISSKLNDWDEAIHIARFLVNDNPQHYDNYYFLLSLYLSDRKYEDEFNAAKKYLLDNFNLKGSELRMINALKYEDL